MEQYALAHEPLPGERLPRPCPCCNFCHNKSTAKREYEEEKAKREELRADDSKAGRAKYARWQCERANKHLNIKAGPEGLSVFGQATPLLTSLSSPCGKAQLAEDAVAVGAAQSFER